MRLIKLFAAAFGLLSAGALAAQTPEDGTSMTPPPPPPLEAENSWMLDLSTGGRVVIQLRSDVAPGHVERIRTLTRQGFYDGLAFHRVVEGFMAQGGDPTGTGTGGSELPDLQREVNGLPHMRGSVAMARSDDPNSANSQFYIMFAPRLGLDRGYTVFGRVVRGMQFIDAIERGEPPLAPSRIVRASIGSDNVAEMSPEQLRAAAARLAAANPAPQPQSNRRVIVPAAGSDDAAPADAEAEQDPAPQP